jgi:HD-GYP domain-containing protein (c-di-GMP phosphodiesterase class II)
VLQVVDVFDALTTARPYKPAISQAHAKETMIHEAKRGLWDFELVREFFGMIEAERKAA